MSVEQDQSQPYPWHQPVWENLTQRFPHLGHGLLFYGRKGCAKAAFAQRFLSWVLCTQKQTAAACGQCSSCLWLKSGTHPNYVRISNDDEPSKNNNAKIKIDSIRELLPFVQQTVDGWRVVLIEPAEALNIASANALLKTLEEPGERVVIILLAEHFSKLPATVRSRLQHFALDRVSPAQAMHYVQQHAEAVSDSEHLALLLELASGMPLLACELSAQPWFVRRAEFVQDWTRLVQHKNAPLQYASKWHKELSLADMLQLLSYIVADLVAMKLQQPPKNSDLDLTALAQQFELEKLFELYDQLQQAQQLSQQNVQSNLIIDQLFVQLMHVRAIT
ncbi:DNA polymerase III subunit delta' [Acinetobacter larvae]|uniref:DNA-directed DNA polymerase n=1 Tax=Acinetobacter larvae TaxID=1789224 RepID=A0A1B2LYJ8_9GAMM|nr:DNA polymerase III subunit delta' [Acinetobacter larvae]AOA57959.1 DNA polymerase III subunit delta' [Acinetobacter larvae]